MCCESGRGLNVDTSLAGNAGMLRIRLKKCYVNNTTHKLCITGEDAGTESAFNDHPMVLGSVQHTDVGKKSGEKRNLQQLVVRIRILQVAR